MAKDFARMSPERMLLGARRFLNASWICMKFGTVRPFLHPGETNEFARGVQALNDQLFYRSDVIPARQLWDAYPGIDAVDVTLGRILPTEGSTGSTYEQFALAALVKHTGARRLFEIGTSQGVTSYNLARNLPPDGVLYTLDLPDSGGGGEVGTRFRVSNSDSKMIFMDRSRPRFCDTDVSDRIVRLHGDSATFDYSAYAGSIDIVFVDGAHSYDYVKSDTRAAMQLVRPGGLVVWHDYNDGYFWPDVAKYLLEFARVRPMIRIAGTMYAVAQVGTEVGAPAAVPAHAAAPAARGGLVPAAAF